jgi:hypothetical protein
VACIVCFANIQYAILVWGHSASRHRLFRLQRRAIRIIAKLGYKDDYHEYFQKLNILTLPCLYIYKCLERIIKSLDSYPTLGAVHDYHTRAEAISFKTIRLSKSKDGIHYFCIQFFNKLPTKITKTINEKMLLSKIKSYSYLIEKSFFSLLVSEGVIIDSRADPTSRISLPRLIIIFIINQGQ